MSHGLLLSTGAIRRFDSPSSGLNHSRFFKPTSEIDGPTGWPQFCARSFYHSVRIRLELINMLSADILVQLEGRVRKKHGYRLIQIRRRNSASNILGGIRTSFDCSLIFNLCSWIWLWSISFSLMFACRMRISHNSRPSRSLKIEFQWSWYHFRLRSRVILSPE